MPHTPTERSFDKHFLRCGGKTKCRRKAHELRSGLIFSRIASVCASVLPSAVPNRGILMKNANMYAHTQALRHTRTIIGGGEVKKCASERHQESEILQSIIKYSRLQIHYSDLPCNSTHTYMHTHTQRIYSSLTPSPHHRPSITPPAGWDRGGAWYPAHYAVIILQCSRGTQPAEHTWYFL